MAFWKWAIDKKIPEDGSVLGASFLAHIKRPAVRHYLSHASFDAVGGYCPELKIFWRYALDPNLSATLRQKADTKETCAISISLLEVCGLFLTAFVVEGVVRDRSKQTGDPVLMRGDNASTVSWVNRCEGLRGGKAGLILWLLRRVEIVCG